MAHEVWRDIADFEGLYQVSNFGRVRSLDRVVKHGSSQMRLKGRVLSPRVPTPYLGVILSKNGKAYPKRIHRLVAQEFVPNPDNLPAVDHIDGDKTNNAASNLRWCSQKQNIGYANDKGLLRTVPYSERTEEQKKRYSESRKKTIVRSDGKVYRCTSDAAQDMGVTYAAVMHVLRGITRTCKGYGFTYA